MPILRIAPRWLEEPLRVVDGKGSIEVVDIDDLDLSEELADRIEAWVDVFDATFQPGQSAFSGFADEASERLWRREAASLAADIADELGEDWQVALDLSAADERPAN